MQSTEGHTVSATSGDLPQPIFSWELKDKKEHQMDPDMQSGTPFKEGG